MTELVEMIIMLSKALAGEIVDVTRRFIVMENVKHFRS